MGRCRWRVRRAWALRWVVAWDGSGDRAQRSAGGAPGRVKRARCALSKYAILWLSRVTEKEYGAVVLLSSSVCLSPLSCESLQRARAFIGHTRNFEFLCVVVVTALPRLDPCQHGRAKKKSLEF